ncbi:hypothetical protein CONLIGDRAFT_660573 [Coniochaeta ligniaria NRRL 30616]|uniref:Zn(2)-C6 fungal-type domain-containing protein n=1 Tax=Coniochaeta ligniaria NRRL 30616 TaxID=1408157 RepID=A0A1J7IZ74_9PEZI|nr:hypothetical protein CONLIGDRAFT_660573 [Coniochaeta ligniaria NRRL 30616]
MENVSWQAADGADMDSGSSRLSARGEDEDGLSLDDLPACQSCRRRKSKCSRERPSCSQCIRLRAECIYITKQKPGLKAGAIDNLSSRLRVLEELFLDNVGNRKPQLAFLDVDAEEVSNHRLESLTSASDTRQHNEAEESPIVDERSSLDVSSQHGGPRKRRRVDEPEQWSEIATGPWMPPLPALPLLEAVVEAHFRTLHHWMPILHETRFRAKLKDGQERARLAVLFHALDFGMALEDAERQIRISRRAVMLNAMESLSLENTQALVFLAFDYMGSGDVTKAWPIIGSLTRTVNYLQLTVEPDDDSRKQQLLRSLSILEKPQDWTDSEGRRRLFWVIFLLDRICSVSSGWHTSLTSDDMHRRLPCSGGLWAREEPVSTPFFGIWDKSAARIGNSIANVPNMYPSPRAMEQPNTPSVGDVDTSKLGAFAHCIEATENLSQVTAFFLQQDVDFGDRREVKDWLTRFKELDLRLVHWKMFLPQQWQDSNVSRDASIVKMDPNLTLAHITHNTSMILLHQHIAYPPVSWKDVVKLPSSCSIETCQLAAVETASIVEKYLRYTGGIVNSQFAFCAFVAARVLLVQWRSSEVNSLAPAFSSLLRSLQDMSARWLGFFSQASDLAARYASQLSGLQSRCASDVNFAPAGLAEILLDSSFEGFVEKQTRRIDTQQQNGSYASLDGRRIDRMHQRSPVMTSALPGRHTKSPSTVAEVDRQYQLIHPNTIPVPRPTRHARPIMEHSGQGSSIAAQGTITHSQYGGVTSPTLSAPHMDTNGRFPVTGPVPMDMGGFGRTQPSLSEEDELAAMSQMLLEHQFLQMDRVIRLDGTEFWA